MLLTKVNMHNNIKNKIIDLTKNILLRNPINNSEYMQWEFDRYELWIKNNVIKKLTFTIHDNDERFKTFDMQTIEESIRKTIKEMVKDDTIFNTDDIWPHRKLNLFECRTDLNDVNSYSKKIYNKISGKITSSVDSRLVLYPLFGIISESFFVDKEDIGILKKQDQDTWEKLKKDYRTSKWTPAKPDFSDAQKLKLNPDEYNVMLYALSTDTRYKANEVSELKARKLISLIFAIIYNNKIREFRSIGNPHQYVIYFGEKHSYTINWSMQNKLLPKYSFGMSIQYKLTDNDIDNINSWYQQYHKIPDTNAYQLKNRINVCGHFINLAMNSDGASEYVNYYTALDALFGVQRNTGNSIVDGVTNLIHEDKIELRMQKLYRLRNDLVHGGIRFTQEWSGYRKYCDDFGIAPENDIKMIAFRCFLESPKYIPQITTVKQTFLCKIVKKICRKNLI